MILIVGATGALGGEITHRLLTAGHPVRVLIREGADPEAFTRAGARVVSGDLKDPESLRAAVRGVHAVITTANSAARGGADDVDSVEIAGNRSFVDAAKDARVGQFIFVSALGAEQGSPVPFLRGKALAEQHLKDSGMPYTILRPNVFMEVWIGMIVAAPIAAGQPVTLVGTGERKHSFVSSHDVASFALAVLGAPEAMNRTLVIGGPEPLSWRQILDAAAEIIGRPIELRNIEPGQAVPGMPDSVSQIAAGLETYDSPIDMAEIAYEYGVSLTPVDTVLRSLLQA